VREKIDDDLIHETALMSYYLDYYLPLYTKGNFRLFYNYIGTKLNELIEEGLTLLGAVRHLELFQQQKKSN
jgi:hypothetical protein